jgi:hypothetical protein
VKVIIDAPMTDVIVKKNIMVISGVQLADTTMDANGEEPTASGDLDMGDWDEGVVYWIIGDGVDLLVSPENKIYCAIAADGQSAFCFLKSSHKTSTFDSNLPTLRSNLSTIDSNLLKPYTSQTLFAANDPRVMSSPPLMKPFVVAGDGEPIIPRSVNSCNMKPIINKVKPIPNPIYNNRIWRLNSLSESGSEFMIQYFPTMYIYFMHTENSCDM